MGGEDTRMPPILIRAKSVPEQGQATWNKRRSSTRSSRGSVASVSSQKSDTVQKLQAVRRRLSENQSGREQGEPSRSLIRRSSFRNRQQSNLGRSLGVGEAL